MSSVAAVAVPAVSANRRILARFIDTWVLGFVGSFLVIVIWTLLFGAMSEELANNRAFSSWLAVLSMAILDVPCTKLWGRTPGKALLGIRVQSTTGDGVLTWNQASKRAMLVWVRGLALGIPLVWLVTASVAMRRVTRTGLASWDEAASTRVVSARAA